MVRIGDPTRVQVIVKRHRTVAHDGVGMELRVAAHGYSDRTEMLVGGTVFEHMPLAHPRIILRRSAHTVWHVEVAHGDRGRYSTGLVGGALARLHSRVPARDEGDQH